MHTKKLCYTFETMFTMNQNKQRYVYNWLKYKKQYNKLYLNFLLDKVFLTNVYEYFNKLTAFDCKFDYVWITFRCCHTSKV